MVDAGIFLGLLGRRMIAWFVLLRSANPNEASRIQPSTVSVVFAARYIPHTRIVVMLAYLLDLA